LRAPKFITELGWAVVLAVGLVIFLLAGVGLGWGLLHAILESW